MRQSKDFRRFLQFKQLIGRRTDRFISEFLLKVGDGRRRAVCAASAGPALSEAEEKSQLTWWARYLFRGKDPTLKIIKIYFLCIQCSNIKNIGTHTKAGYRSIFNLNFRFIRSSLMALDCT